MRQHNILVACHDIVLSGGLLRFDRLGATLAQDGHKLSYAVLAAEPRPARTTQLDVYTFAQAARMSWSAVMVPGAGFPDATIEAFAALRAPNFGRRIQHVLNDRSFAARFKAVNAALLPDVVLFNNRDWLPGTFTDLHAQHFHVLLGAVDVDLFRAEPRMHPLQPSAWTIGGLAGKNPQPLVAALRQLPSHCKLHLFGPDPFGLRAAHADLVAAGRMVLTGPLDDAGLARFYRTVDCVVATERYAGWANLAAEAMASGVPVACTAAGTAAFATHERSVLRLDAPEVSAIAAAVMRLHDDAALGARLAREARRVIETFSWRDYAREFLNLIDAGDGGHCAQSRRLG